MRGNAGQHRDPEGDEGGRQVKRAMLHDRGGVSVISLIMPGICLGSKKPLSTYGALRETSWAGKTFTQGLLLS